MGSHISDFFRVRQFFIFTVSKRTRMFFLKWRLKCCSFNLKNGSIHCCRASAGSIPKQTIFLSDLRFFVQWFHGSMVQSICDCSAVQSAVCLSKCLAAAPVFLLGATRHFVLLSCKICAEIVVYRMLAVFLNGLNGKNSSRSIVRNIFSVYFFYSRFQD